MIGIVAIALLGLAPRHAQFAAWGAEPLRAIQHNLFRPDRGVYTEEGTAASAQAIDLPAETELVLALAAAAAYDAKLLPDLKTAIAAAEKYWNPSGPTPGFCEVPFSTSSHRSYADNAALALALNEAARVAKSAKAAELAGQALSFALSGEDAKAGGVAEVEGVDSAKTANSTASVAQAILSQSDLSTPKHAEELYTWIRSNLRDPATNLFSAVAAGPGTDRAAPGAGDTARMIEVASLLFRATGDEKFGEQARRLEVLSVGRWFQPDGELSTDTVGGVRLAEAWIDRIRMCPRPTETYGASADAYASLQRLHDDGRDRGRHYGHRFGVPPKPAETWGVLDQAAAARAFYAAALSLRDARK
jgi:hypothetical protein